MRHTAHILYNKARALGSAVRTVGSAAHACGLTAGARFTSLALVLAALLALTACDHKELCYDHSHTVRARIDVDWSLFTEEQPSGMSVMLYPETGEGPYNLVSNTLEYVDVNVPVGRYRAVVFNQSPGEFGTLTFSDMDSEAAATVRAAARSSRWYQTRADAERLVQNPEWFAVGEARDINVPEEVALQQQSRAATRSTIATVVPRCVVYTIHVRVHVKNIYNVRSARASLDGLADGYSFARMRPTSTVATQLLENWTLTHDADNPANGTLETRITSFGLPAGHRAVADANHLRLSLLLVDGTTQRDFDFAVGSSFVRGPEVELSLSLSEAIDEPLPDVKPSGGSAGGFDATVDDWEEGEHVDIGV